MSRGRDEPGGPKEVDVFTLPCFGPAGLGLNFSFGALGSMIVGVRGGVGVGAAAAGRGMAEGRGGSAEGFSTAEEVDSTPSIGVDVSFWGAGDGA